MELATGHPTSTEDHMRHMDGGAVLSLTHHSLNMQGVIFPFAALPSDAGRWESLLYFHGRVVFVLRNPFASILSFFRHLTEGVHSNTELEDRCNSKPTCPG